MIWSQNGSKSRFPGSNIAQRAGNLIPDSNPGLKTSIYKEKGPKHQFLDNFLKIYGVGDGKGDPHDA